MSESNEEMKGNETKQDEPKREKVRVADISLIKDFLSHPFLVKDDESMAQFVKSIEMNGVLNPVMQERLVKISMSLYRDIGENTLAYYLELRKFH